MEKPFEEPPTADASDCGEIRQLNGTRVRRRLVQSTLFPIKPQDSGKVLMHCGQDEDKGSPGDQEDEFEIQSNTKKRRSNRKRNTKTIPQSRSSKKVASSDEVALQRGIGENSPDIGRASEIQLLKRQLNFDSLEVNDETCSPPDSAASMESPGKLKQGASATPKKQRVNSTPKKRMTRDLKDSCSEKMSTKAEQSENILKAIPDLRLEAKKRAEENSRLFAGKQIHPFFISCKMGKKYQESTDMENKWCTMERKDFRPIHVFEKDQEDVTSLDWGKWKFSDESHARTGCELESPCSVVYKGSVNSLEFDNFLTASHEMQEYSNILSPKVLTVEQVLHCELECEKEEVAFRKNWNVECQEKYLPERLGMMSYSHGCMNQPKNCLWTTKYQPKKSTEVCGNGESVKFLNEWLQEWQERDYQNCRSLSSVDKWIVQDDDYSMEADSDAENMDDDSNLKNVLLIMGPVGSGKSAAVYACAKEQGFQVIEVNASDWRNGTLVKQKFGEAVESHWLQSTGENLANSESNGQLKSLPAVVKTMTSHVADGEVIELVHLSDEEDFKNASKPPSRLICKENMTIVDQNETKTLILFEDVDATLCDDRGFISTIQQLSQTAKRPMILTSNNNNPILPNNLDRLEVYFTRPSHEELLQLVYMVCDAEKATIQPCLVERFIECCQGDIRKTIMHVQFWCQGQSDRNDNEVQRTYFPLLFDIDAGHKILPEIIPWGYPSQLSELVEEEITKSLMLVEENSRLTEMVDEEDPVINKTWKWSEKIHSEELDPVEAKKEAMLSRHCSTQDVHEFATHFNVPYECSNSSGSPVAFTRRNVWRKVDAVLSSVSGEEYSDVEMAVISGTQVDDTNNEVLFEVNSKSPTHFMATERYFSPLTEQLLPCEGEKLQDNVYQHPETADSLNFNDTCKSVDVSCVPESSFVPETVVKDDKTLFSSTVSSGFNTDGLELPCTTSDFMPDLPLSEDNNLVRLRKNPGMVKNSFDLNVEPVNGEEVGDSHLGSMEASERTYQIMDECSQMHFSRKYENAEESRTLIADSVQETWRKLRSCHMDIRQYVTPEQKDASRVMKLSYELSNLVSVADLLRSDCQPLISLQDAAELSRLRCENSVSSDWYDEHLQMTSVIAEHGICFYAKEIVSGGSHLASASKMDLAWEMLTTSTNTMALGKLLTLDLKTSKGLTTGSSNTDTSSKSVLESSLCSIVQSIVPLRLHLRLKDDAFHEYLSSLGQISKSEASRISDSTEKPKRRRGRAPQHYLSAGSLMLSPEDISLLNQYNYYAKFLISS